MVMPQVPTTAGRQRPLKGLESLPIAIPHQSGLYIILLQAPRDPKPRFGPSGLDIYSGQDKG